MAIPNNLTDLEKAKYVESTAVPNKTTVAVTNADGTPIASADVDITEDTIGTRPTVRKSNTGTEQRASVSAAEQVGRFYLAVQPINGDLFIGPTGVTPATGEQIFEGSKWWEKVKPGVELFVISDGSTVSWQVTEGAA